MSENNNTPSNDAPNPQAVVPQEPLKAGDSIDGSDRALRIVNPAGHLDKSSKPYRLSSGLFSEIDGGISVDVESLILASGSTVEQRTEQVTQAKPELGTLLLRVKEVNDQGYEVKYDPVVASATRAANPFHANILGVKSKSQRRRLLASLTIEWVKKVQGME